MNVLNRARQKSGSSTSWRKLVNPTKRGGERISHCVKLRSSETTIGPAVNARNPMIHGEINKKPAKASRFARGDISSLGPPGSPVAPAGALMPPAVESLLQKCVHLAAGVPRGSIWSLLARPDKVHLA